jgi:hypothetical protein
LALFGVWAIGVGRALAGSPCNPFAHAGFYPLMTVPAAMAAVALGIFAGSLAGNAIGALAHYLLIVLASLVWTAWPLIKGPQVYLFSFFLGYFPGPLYDEALSVRPGLLWFEAYTVALSLALLFFTVLLMDVGRGRARRPHFRLGALLFLSVLGAVIWAFEHHAEELGFRMTYAQLAARLGGMTESDHFVLYYPLGKPKRDVEQLTRDLEFRYAQLQAFLHGAPAEKLRVYVYRSAEEKETLVGAARTQFSKPWHLSVHVNDAPFPHPTLKHELAHAMAAPLGSGPFRVTSHRDVWPLMGIIEGFAVAADNPVQELTLHEWAAAMRRQKLAPDLRRLLDPQGFYASAAPRAYTLVGSFLRYLADTYGHDALDRLYAHGDFQGVYQKSLDELVSAWEKFLDGLTLDEEAVNRAFARFREPPLFDKSCAREVVTLAAEADARALSDPARALPLYQRCAGLEPQEPAYRLGEAGALEAIGKTPSAREVLKTAADELKGHPAVWAQLVLALADVEWRAGDRDDAATELRSVLAKKPGADIERNALVKLSAMGPSPSRSSEAIWRYLQPGHGELRVLDLQLALEAEPQNPMLLYLLGRRLAMEGWPWLAAEYLGRALIVGLPGPIAKEAWRLKTQAEFEASDCPQVRKDVGRMPDFGTALRATVDEWRERCDFEDAHFHGTLSPPRGFR